MEDSTEVRNSSNSSNTNKMLPSQGLKTKAHGACSPTASKEEESKGSGSKKENSSAEKGFTWGPQTRTSIKK